MNGFTEISIQDRGFIEEILNKNTFEASEITFAYLYMWQCDYGFQYALKDGWLLLISESSYDIPFALCPIPTDGQFERKSFDAIVSWLNERFAQEKRHLVFGRVEEKFVPWFSGMAGAEFTIERSDLTADYVYDASLLRELPGRKYSSKRNHISQFIRQFPDAEVIEVSSMNLDICRQIIADWCAGRGCTCGSPESCEKYAFNRMLDVWDELDMSGIILKVSGIYSAFTVGERLTPDTAVIRYEKAIGEIHGIYAYLNREYLRSFWPDVVKVNREEDMGMEGLRKAKLSYYPIHMIEKYTLFLQG